jgi:hypothetical protein
MRGEDLALDRKVEIVVVGDEDPGHRCFAQGVVPGR